VDEKKSGYEFVSNDGEYLAGRSSWYCSSGGKKTDKDAFGGEKIQAT
jgi:hypothetical protein